MVLCGIPVPQLTSYTIFNQIFTFISPFFIQRLLSMDLDWNFLQMHLISVGVFEVFILGTVFLYILRIYLMLSMLIIIPSTIYMTGFFISDPILSYLPSCLPSLNLTFEIMWIGLQNSLLISRLTELNLFI